MSGTQEKIRHILVEKFNVSFDQISPTTSLRNDLGMDSLDAAELIMELETEFHMVIPDEEAESLETVGDLFQNVEKHLA